MFENERIINCDMDKESEILWILNERNLKKSQKKFEIYK